MKLERRQWGVWLTAITVYALIVLLAMSALSTADLVEAPDPAMEPAPAAVGASGDSERHKAPVEAPSPPAKREGP